MEVKYSVSFIIIAFIALRDVTATATTKDVRTGGLLKPQAEKIINGVIDIVQSHKNKPQQNQYQNYPQYPQQWNSQANYQNGNFQNGFNSQTQYQGQFNGQGQYNYQNGYNQAGNFAQNNNYQGFSAPSQGFSTQGQNQQYQIVYQNTPNQFGQATNVAQTVSGQNGQYYGTTQAVSQQGSTGQYQGNGQYQGSGQYQGNNGHYQGSTGQYQGNGQYQGSSGHYQGNESGTINGQGFLVPNNQGQGPTCVCQAWTKPQSDVLSDAPLPDKVEKAGDPMQQARLM
ncbi:unnamed protein product [Colias eurytheme]|nr:unnamed protein product [Colias eurytheme]